MRRRRARKRNPETVDILIGVGLVAAVGGIGYYLYTKSAAATTPVATSTVNGTAVALNSSGQIIPTSSLTPAQQGALAAQNSAAAAAALANSGHA